MSDQTLARGTHPRVLLACDLPDAVRDVLADGLDVVPCALARMSPEMEADGVIVSVETPLTAGDIARLPNGTIAVGTYSVGTNHVDLPALARRGIPLLSTPDVLSASVAEIAVLLALGSLRRVTESIALIRSGHWAGWTPGQLLGHELTGKTAGIFGMGRIGREIAQRLSGLGMEIAYHNRQRLPAEAERGARFCPTLADLLATSDLVVVACPANDETIGAMDDAMIGKMKTGAHLVNVSRGSVVVDEALIAALQSGKLAGAGLDVLAGEPDFDPRYLDLPNVFLLPHIGSSTVEARVRMAAILRDGFLSVAAGERPANLVTESIQ